MRGRLSDIAQKNLKRNFFLYFFVIVFFIIGVSAGAITTKVLNLSQRTEIIKFMNSFFQVLTQEKIDSVILLKHSLENNLKTILILWLSGIIMIGIPIIISVLIIRGFIIGFTVGFLIIELGLKGFLFAILIILPQNLLIIPGMLLMSAFSLDYCKRSLFRKRRLVKKYNYTRETLYFSLITLAITCVIVFGSIIEAYITPVFMRALSSYM